MEDLENLVVVKSTLMFWGFSSHKEVVFCQRVKKSAIVCSLTFESKPVPACLSNPVRGRGPHHLLGSNPFLGAGT